MKSKIVLIVSLILIIVSATLITISVVKDKKNDVTVNEVEEEDNIYEGVKIEKLTPVDSTDKKFISELGESNNTIFSIEVSDNIEADTSDQYVDLISSTYGYDVDRYWIESLDDVSEILYWYDLDGNLQSYTISY